MAIIKVQVIGGASVPSVVHAHESNTSNEHPLTFHAFSDEMKARILENFIKSPAKIAISFTNETPRCGEWHEPLVEGAIFNARVGL